MPDVYLRSGYANPYDVVLRDPTHGDSGTAYTLTAAVGTLAFSAKTATLVAGHGVIAAKTSITFSAQSATAVAAHKVSAAKTNLVFTAESATMTAGHGITATKTNLTFTAESATLVAAHKVSAGYGTLAFTAENATLTVAGGPVAYTLVATVGYLSFRGGSADYEWHVAQPSYAYREMGSSGYNSLSRRPMGGS